VVLPKIVATRAPRAIILIRLAVGAVFLSEGIQKFLFPGEPRGPDRLVDAPGFAGASPWSLDWLLRSRSAPRK